MLISKENERKKGIQDSLMNEACQPRSMSSDHGPRSMRDLRGLSMRVWPFQRLYYSHDKPFYLIKYPRRQFCSLTLLPYLSKGPDGIKRIPNPSAAPKNSELRLHKFPI